MTAADGDSARGGSAFLLNIPLSEISCAAAAIVARRRRRLWGALAQRRKDKTRLFVSRKVVNLRGFCEKMCLAINRCRWQNKIRNLSLSV